MEAFTAKFMVIMSGTVTDRKGSDAVG